MPDHTFELPDPFTSSPLTTFEFSPAARAEAADILAAPAEEILGRLLRDRESEPVLLAAKQLLDALLGQAGPAEPDIDADSIAAEVRAVRDELATAADAFSRCEPRVREAVLRERATVGLLGGCWLDLVSQPATQPAVAVNQLFGHHVVLKGHGNPRRSLYQRRRRALEDAGVYLPEIDAADFPRKVGPRPLTALHASWYLALSRYPASYLPELVGVHYALLALGFDDLLTGSAPPLTEPELREVLAGYLALTGRWADGAQERRRLHTAVRLVLLLEREHAALLAELAAWLGDLSLDARVAMIVARHAPFAGSHHRDVRVHGKRLTDTFADPDLDLAAFLTEFRASRQLKPLPGGGSRFLNAIRFGGPMFGIFDESEGATFKAWVERVQAGDLAPVHIPVNRVGDDRAAQWRAAIGNCEPAGVVFADADPVDDREVFFRVVNIEHFPNTLGLARERAERGMASGEVLLVHGAGARYTDASEFDYSPAALQARVDRIYWDKLVNPYRPLTEFPSREKVVFGQMTFALANLVDGAWAHRLGAIGRFQRDSDGTLFSIYADEMGSGDLRKNHITLIYQVLRSLEIPVPHIRAAEFQDQEYMPEGTYDFAIHQVCMSLFPDSLYNELLGYTLGTEMYGLGEVRLHEIEKLRRYGFDTSYDEVHLSIDNVSGGHSRLAIDAIVSHLDLVERMLGPSAVIQEWRRIWRGYASFAFYAEHQYVGTLLGGAADDYAELVI